MPEKKPAQTHADYLADALRRVANDRARVKKARTLADYIGDALTPLLIMALIGSLVYFLIDAAYVGDFAGRLRWVLFFYVFGAVLIGRIALEADIAPRAPIYTLLLGAAIFVALLQYVEYPPAIAPFAWMINLAFILLIWWCAGRLTRDCHFEDDDEEASGKGLLQAAGIEDENKGIDKPPPGLDTFAGKAQLKRSCRNDESISWWGRFAQYREERKRRPRTPGLWVVYFSLAALPIFGFGQALIPVDYEEIRRHAFWMMVYYVASGLGLLLTTCFLGLRRYLRQRGLQMPAPMAGAWFGIGGGFVLALLIVGALLPRPSDEYPIIPWSRIGSAPREASDYAMKNDSPGKGQGRASNESSKDRKAEDGDGGKRDNDAKTQTQGKDNPGGQQGKNSQGNSKGDQQGKNSGNQNKSGDDSSTNKKSDHKENAKDEDSKKGDKSTQDDNKDRDKENRDISGSKASNEQRGSGSPRSARNSSSTSRSPSSPSSPALGKVAGVVKWIVYVLLALAALYVLFRFGWSILKQLAQFTLWARRLMEALQSLWQNLFGWWGRESTSEKRAVPEVRERVPSRSFSSYGNPFADGRAERMAPAQLVRYSFEALQAWAREADLQRETGETPSEFLRRLAEEVPPLEGELKGLEAIYMQVAYAGVAATSTMRKPLHNFWEQLTTVAERPLSAGAQSSV